MTIPDAPAVVAYVPRARVFSDHIMNKPALSAKWTPAFNLAAVGALEELEAGGIVTQEHNGWSATRVTQTACLWGNPGFRAGGVCLWFIFWYGPINQVKLFIDMVLLVSATLRPPVVQIVTKCTLMRSFVCLCHLEYA